METVAVFESRVPSFTVKMNESGPLKFASGVYVRAVPVPVNAPCDGPDRMV